MRRKAITTIDPLSPLDLGVPEDRATTAKGALRVAEILQVALEILAAEGQAGLTLEGGAQRVGIRKGNIQYYFPSRADLLRAALVEQIEAHRRQWSAVYDGLTGTPEARLRQLIAFETRINRDKTFIAQVRERWALEERDEEARRLTSRWYDWVTGVYATLIAEIRPDLGPRACRHLAIMMYAMLVGSASFFGPRRASPRWTKDLDKTMAEAIVTLVKTAPPGEG